VNTFALVFTSLPLWAQVVVLTVLLLPALVRAFFVLRDAFFLHLFTSRTYPKKRLRRKRNAQKV
jgi:hypothetical protein